MRIEVKALSSRSLSVNDRGEKAKPSVTWWSFIEKFPWLKPHCVDEALLRPRDEGKGLSLKNIQEAYYEALACSNLVEWQMESVFIALQTLTGPPGI